MYLNDNKVTYSEIMKIIIEDNDLKNFDYYDVFKNKWNKMLKKYMGDTNYFVIKNLSDEDQGLLSRSPV
jgi:hypothetical protein